ncbi:MAG: ferrous iron transport protein B [Spirochaetales bacterium]|nr:ferrous iron transport protein B [Spirochaetales bacterium]
MNNPVLNKPITIALAGQPNTGKSTVFNRLTGAKQHVGNWPGKTVEQKSGLFTYNNNKHHVVDLPGTYSLTSNSLEEQIARDFIVNEKPDVVVVMADASQLERTLYLLTEIRLLSVPVVVALNMIDIAEEQGKTIDSVKLESQLGIRVVPMAAAKGRGIDLLLEAVENAAAGGVCTSTEQSVAGNPYYKSIRSIISGKFDGVCSEQWMTVKLIEGDSKAVETVKNTLSAADWKSLKELLDKIENGQLITAGARYSWINDVLSSVVNREGESTAKRRGVKFDRAATHPVVGKMIALLIMVLSFAMAMIIVMPIMGLVQSVIPGLVELVRETFSGSSLWFGSLLADGLIPGLFVAFMMLCYVFGVYIVFGLLEDIGYLSRMAYVFDSSMSKIGLHGKSVMPLLMSFGCNIAGVTGTRVIDSWQQRMVTLVLVSIVPCMALWAVVSFMGTIFFAAAMPLVVLSLLLVMVLHISLTSAVLRKFVVKGETTGLIMELPPYHKPNWRTIWGHVWVQVKAFLKRAFTLIAALSIIVWALSYQQDGNMGNSILASIGRFFDPISSFLGLDWRLFIALLAAIIAKEASLSVIAVLYGLGAGAVSITSLLIPGSGGFEEAALIGTIAQSVSPASALAFIFAFFFSIPCLGTVATIHSETKSLKWTIGASLYYTVTSLVLGGLAYRVGLLIF